ncbi:DUF4381 family protein [Scandinavium sp. NPDC088450]|uniref:DUF4381 family protein n=1 Tax=Scandinavium sp. NPDC088450 TaxID=3364514 RepID=UPI00384D550E
MLEKGFTVPALSHPALPASPSWLPLPAGWLVLGALLLSALAIYLFFRVARWRRNLWRREALSIFSASHSVDNWLRLIKQILLVHHPRDEISQNIEPESLLQHVPVDKELQRVMCAKYCQRDNQLEPEQETRLRHQLAHWLKELPDV